MSTRAIDRSGAAPRAAAAASLRKLPWLFSPAVDLWTFLGSGLLALGLLALGAWRGWLDDDSPEWLWISAVVLIDVAHVYATGFRVYIDRAELRRRPWLYGLVPVLAFVVGVAVYSEGTMLFWRTLAYLAVFHFVRQQFGWVALYRARGRDHDPVGRVIDTAAIYLATLYPLIYWHAHPRQFSWLVASDFAQIPTVVEQIVAPIYWSTMAVYATRALLQAVRQQSWNPGKDVVVLTTAVCWYVGIVSLNSDYAFTVTNVIIHGLPYMVLVYWHRQRRILTGLRAGHNILNRWSVITFVGALWLLAFAEELLWDCGVWHERPWLFGPGWDIGDLDQLLVPLLAVPQITHYVLDGFIWKRRANPHFTGEVFQ